jgi:hypothetical protein
MLGSESYINSTKNALFDQLLSSIKEAGSTAVEDYINYQDNPVAFGEDVLGETYTEEVKALMESVRNNPITLAKSANAVGKTHAAARVSVWWFKCFPGSQIFTGAAPPESNLKKLETPGVVRVGYGNKPSYPKVGEKLFNRCHYPLQWDRSSTRSQIFWKARALPALCPG